MILCGGKQLEGPIGVSSDEHLHDENVEIDEKKMSASFNVVVDNDVRESNEIPKTPSKPPQNLLLSLCRSLKDG